MVLGDPQGEQAPVAASRATNRSLSGDVNRQGDTAAKSTRNN